MQNKNKDKFNFFVPIELDLEKAKSSGNGEMKIKGICSSATEDSDGEVLYPEGFKFDDLLTKGFFNYNHQANKSASAIIGEPTFAQVINGGQDFYVEGFLYKGDKEAEAFWNKCLTLEKNGSNRKPGFSIEGQTILKDPLNPKKILKANITGIALTFSPKNPNTLAQLIKGEYSEPFVENDESEDDLDGVQNVNKLYNIVSYGGEVMATGLTYEEAIEKNNQFNGSLLEMSIDKAISVESTPQIQMESVEGGHKILDDVVNAKRLLKKSEVYDLILDKYPSANIEKSVKIFELIKQTANNLYNMEDNTISLEAINKSFEVIDNEIKIMRGEKNDIVKSEENSETLEENVVIETPVTSEENAEVLENENVEKSENIDIEKAKGEEDSDDEEKEYISGMAKKRIEKGMSKEECVEDMIKKGISLEVAQTATEKIISEIEASKVNGGEVEQGVGNTTFDIQALSKSIAEELKKSIEAIQLNSQTVFTPTENNTEVVDLIKGEVVDLIKSQNLSLSTSLEALGSIQKSTIDNVNEIKKSLEEQIDVLKAQIQEIGNTPNQRKSIVKAVEKFDIVKSNADNEYSLGNKNDVKNLTEKLFDESMRLRAIGRTNPDLEKAVQYIEGGAGIDPDTMRTISPILKSLNIDIVK